MDPAYGSRADNGRQGPSGPRANELLDAREAFEWVRIKYSHRASSTGSTLGMPRFARETEFGLREARLLCLAWPEKTRGLALASARDDSKDVHERSIALYMLGQLAARNDQTAEAALARIAELNSDRVGRIALSRLQEADAAGKYCGFYLDKCAQGVHEAFRRLGQRSDLGMVETMERIAAANPGIEFPQCNTRLLALKVKKRVELLLSPTCDRQLLDIVRDVESPRSDWFLWALRVALLRRTEGLEEVLRARLDRIARSNEFAKGPPALPRSDIEKDADAPRDLRFDDLLVAQFELGGALRGYEQRRLHTFGYGCDPETRLRELIPQ